MSKWVLNTFQGIKVWYSSDVIDKIKKLVERSGCEFCDDIAGECENCVFVEIKKILDEEDKC